MSEKTRRHFCGPPLPTRSSRRSTVCFYAKALSDHGVPYELHVYPLRPVTATLLWTTRPVPHPCRRRTPGAAEWVEEAKRWLRLSLLK